MNQTQLGFIKPNMIILDKIHKHTYFLLCDAAYKQMCGFFFFFFGCKIAYRPKWRNKHLEPDVL